NEYTLFLPTNDVVKSMLLSVSSFFTQMNMDFTAADTNRVMTWMLKSVIHRGRRTNYPSGASLYSVFGNEWRTDKEFVKEDFATCSNGNVFVVSTLVFPRKEYMEKLEIRPYYAFTLPKEKQDELFKRSEGVSLSLWGNVDGGHDLFNVQIPSKDKAAWVTFQAIVRNERGQVEAKKVMPGVYRLSTSFRSYACNKIALYAVYNDNGKDEEVLIKEFDPREKYNVDKKTGPYYYVPIADAGVDNPKSGFNGLLEAKFEVKPDWGYDYLRFKMVNVGGADRMTPEYFVLEPTDDNY
ncbi:MAG: hypothetical protein K2L23_00565, partial [Odoribacter sp.]|nr:hypothetical protein [Odoribacter sp.]